MNGCRRTAGHRRNRRGIWQWQLELEQLELELKQPERLEPVLQLVYMVHHNKAEPYLGSLQIENDQEPKPKQKAIEQVQQ